MNTTAHIITEDGQQWVRITPPSGYCWDEPIEGWERVINLNDGSITLRHKPTNREYTEET